MVLSEGEVVEERVAVVDSVVGAEKLPGTEGTAPDLQGFQSPSRTVGACLQYYWTIWQKLGASARVVKLLRRGYEPLFKLPCPVTSESTSRSLPVDQVKLATLDKEIEELSQKGATELSPPQQLGFYSHMFLVPKQNGQWRPVIDLKALNVCLEIPTFHMETLESIRAAMRQGDWTVSIDLSDAYFHVPIHKDFRRFLMFSHRDKVWQFRALPFGLATAPRVFTMVMEEVKCMAAKRGLTIHMYLDDWLIRAQSPVLLRSQCRWFLDLCARLGLQINLVKSDLEPSQKFTFLGCRFDTITHRVYPSDKRLKLIDPLLKSFSSRIPHTARKWESLLGLLSATEKTVPLGRAHVRGLQRCLASQWSPEQDHRWTIVRVDRDALVDIRWWQDPVILEMGCPTQPLPHDLEIYTDSSVSGWGAHMGGLTVSGVWSPQSAQLHINNLELRAVVLALEHWQAQLHHRVILVVTDNTTVMSYINKQGGTRSRSLSVLATRLHLFCFKISTSIRAKHIAGRLNVLADSLSRKGQVLHTEWSLCPVVFKQICRLLGTPMVDLFATSYNTKLPVFVSPYPDRSAMETDSLSIPWKGFWGYAYPPTTILVQVLNKIRTEECKIMLIAPAFTRASWFNPLLDLLVEVPRALPVKRTLLRQPRSGIFHQVPETLSLHVWILSNRVCERRAFLKRQPLASRAQLEGPLAWSTTPSGRSSFLGVNQGRLIHSVPLLQS